MVVLREVLDLIETWYPARYAEDWDAVGLVTGDPEQTVERVLLAVDPVQEVADEAAAFGADLLLVHHPLYLRGTTSVAATTPKGRVVHTLAGAGCALLTAHTNADSPAGGVSQSIADALGLVDVRPLQADPVEARDKVVAFVPVTHAEQVRRALADAGAGRIGAYDSASYTSGPGEGRFRPLEGADPAIGRVGDLEVVEEVRVEVIVERSARERMLAALRDAHPYEEPAYDVVALAGHDDAHRGSGRIGRLTDPLTLRRFAEMVGERLRPSAHGVRVAGREDQPVSTVALCGGSGDFLLDTARRAGADVYLTSDLRHHPASEAREHGDLALVDVAHWSAEWTWLPVLAGRLNDALGATVDVRVSTTATDPWTFRV